MKKDLKELISYVFVGGCTTLINFVIYWFVITMMDQGWLFANVISWVGAVIFAFWANKHFVFKSANETGKEAYRMEKKKTSSANVNQWGSSGRKKL